MKCNPEEKTRQKAVSEIVMGRYVNVDIKGWIGMAHETTLRAYRDLLNELHDTKDIADSRLEEIYGLIADYKKANWVTQTAYDTVKLDNMKLKSKLSEFTDSVHDHREKLESRLAYANKLVADQAQSLRDDTAKIKELEEELASARNTSHTVHKRLIDEIASLRASLRASLQDSYDKLTNRNFALSTQPVKTYEERISNLCQKLSETCQKLAITEMGREADLTVFEASERKLVAAVKDLNVGLHRQRDKIVDLTTEVIAFTRQNKEYLRSQSKLIQSEAKLIDEVETLKAKVEAQKRYHRSYYKMNTKLISDNVAQRDSKIKALQGKIDDKNLELDRATHTLADQDRLIKKLASKEHIYLTPMLSNLTLNGCQVSRFGGNLYSGGTVIGKCHTYHDILAVFTKKVLEGGHRIK